MYKQIGQSLVYTNTFVAKDFLDKSIELSKKLYGKYNPSLIDLYDLRAKALLEMGDIDELNRNINQCFLLTLLNYKYISLETVKSLENFRKFSQRIEEMWEHGLYCKKMEEVIEKIFKDEKYTTNIKLLYYYMKVLDGLTSFPEKDYTVELLKKNYKKFTDLQKNTLYQKVIKNSDNLKTDCDPSLIYYIRYSNIKLNFFFNKLVKEEIKKQITTLITDMQSQLGKFHPNLIDPYLLLIKYHYKFQNKDQLNHLISEDWSVLVETVCEENQLLLANYTLRLVNTILTRDKEYRYRLSNLVNLVGENYEQVFNFSKNPQNISNNFLFAEVCYTGAFVCKDEQKMQPWEMVALASEIYSKILGGESEKYKHSIALLRDIEKQYNLSKSKQV